MEEEIQENLPPTSSAKTETRTKVPWSEREGVVPGVMNEKGIFQDAYGDVHYPGGSVVTPAKEDKRKGDPEEPKTKAVKHWKKEHATPQEIAADPFLGLTPKEMRTLELHMEGLTHSEIAKQLGCSQQTIMLRMARTSVQRCINVIRNDHRNELYNLLSDARQVLKDGLDKDMAWHHRMAAAKEVHKVTGQYEAAKEEKPESGEDEMTRFIKNEQVNIQVNNYGIPRTGSNNSSRNDEVLSNPEQMGAEEGVRDINQQRLEYVETEHDVFKCCEGSLE